MDEQEDYKGRISSLPVKVLYCEDRTAYDRWRQLGKEIQRAKNRFWLAFQMYHEEHRSGPKIRKWMDELRAHKREGKKGRKPRCPVAAIPKKLWDSLMEFVRKECPTPHNRSLQLALRRERKTLLERKGRAGAFKQWQYVVAGFGEMPVHSKPAPILFDVQNCPGRDGKAQALIPPQDGNGKDWVFQVRLDRFESPTKRGETKGDSHLDRIVLATGRDKGRVRRILEKIVNGEVKFCGSSLKLGKKGNWYVNLSYREPQEPPLGLDRQKVAWFAPARKRPWWVVVPRKDDPEYSVKYRIHQRGRNIIWVRRQGLLTKQTRNESSRYGSGSRKGHGRKRGVYEARNRLANAKKTHNQQAARELIRVLENLGIGTLKFVSPTGRPRLESTRFLVTAGTTPDRPDSWPWYQMEMMLKRKCEQAGIKLVVV